MERPMEYWKEEMRNYHKYIIQVDFSCLHADKLSSFTLPYPGTGNFRIPVVFKKKRKEYNWPSLLNYNSIYFKPCSDFMSEPSLMTMRSINLGTWNLRIDIVHDVIGD